MKKRSKIITIVLSLLLVFVILASCTKTNITVKFVNYDNSSLASYTIKKGSDAVYALDNPSKPSTPEFDYTFASWDKSLTNITEDTTFTAVYTSAKRKYDIVFNNYDGTLLQTSKVEYGVLPVYSGSVPTKPASLSANYTFVGWDKEITSVKESVTYTATFSGSAILYVITFVNHEGTILQSSNVAYGTLPVYNGQTPEYLLPPGNTTTIYTFVGWSPSIEVVSGNAMYTATFIVQSFVITFNNYDGTLLLSLNVEHGVTPVYNGVVPVKESTPEFDYTFASWDKEIEGATKDTVYTATFTSVTRSYLITFVNFDSTVLQSNEVLYGTLPVYNGSSNVKESTPEFDYVFIGWTPSIVQVNSSALYTATFTAVTRDYLITFNNYDSTILQALPVLYGTLPVYLGATPTKPSTEEFDYVFNGWSPLVVNVIGEATYNALYNEVTRSYVISFNNYDSAVLQSSSVLYGTLPVYAGLTPTKPSTAEFDYTFNGWSPSVVNVIGEATYTALYEAVTRSYTIIFKNYDNTVLQSEVLLYGTSVVYAGATPTKASDEIFDYVFDSWDSEITLVSGDATYTATYNSILITFIVTIDDAPYEVIKGEQAPRPLNDPAPEFGYRFIGYYENESLYDFSSPVTSDITLVSKFEEIILSVKGTVNSVNGLLDYASVQINSLVILTIDGLFEGTIEYDTEFSAIFSKDGYITKTVYFDIEDFVSDEFDAGEIELISNYIVLGSYGTGSVTFNAITEVSRGLKGIYFKTTFNTNDLLETDGIDFFVSIGEAERTVRNINDWCISLRADGRIYIYHYPNNVKILLSSGLDSFPIGLKVSWISLTSSTDLYAYIPYALFSGLDGLDVLNYNDVIGLASTIYNLNGTPYQALNRADLLGASNTAVVAQGNPKDFLRLSLYNELYNANGNYNTVVWGNIGISGVNVSLGTLSVISSSTGAYRFEYNRLSNTPINLEFTKVYYDLLSHPVVFSNLSLYNIGSLTLESQSASITGTVIDLENSNPLENVTVTISNLTVHTNALGEFEINGIINNQNYTLTVSLEDYSVYQFSATQAFLASGNTYLEVSLVSIYAEYQIEGYISNINGDVSGANITVSGTEISVVSGPSGYFTIPSLVVNNYVLVVSCATYLTTSFSLLTSAIQSGTSFIYDMGNLDIALDYYDFGDTGNVTTTNKFNIKGTRNKDGLLFYATTTTTPFPSSGVGIYLQVGYPTINGRTDESFLFMFVPKSPTDVNARLSIYNYPLAQKTTLANHGVTFDWDYTSGAAGKFFIPFAYFNTILPSLNMLNTDTFGITFTIDGNPGSGSQTTLWYKTESEFLGYSMTTEVVRDRPADMLRFDRYNVLSALDNGYFDFNTLKYYTELSQAYNPQVEFSLENLASVNNATYALETVAANAVIFSDRAYYFKLFGVTAGQGVVNAVVGLNYYKVPIAGTTYTVDKAGYIILGVPNSSGSSYPALRVSVAEAGWIQVFYSMYPVGTLTDNMNYCVKYVNLGDTINFGQFVIPFFIKAV